jgi:hypothetical protein
VGECMKLIVAETVSEVFKDAELLKKARILR